MKSDRVTCDEMNDCWKDTVIRQARNAVKNREMAIADDEGIVALS